MMIVIANTGTSSFALIIVRDQSVIGNDVYPGAFMEPAWVPSNVSFISAFFAHSAGFVLEFLGRPIFLFRSLHLSVPNVVSKTCGAGVIAGGTTG